MFPVDLRGLTDGPVRTDGRLPADHPTFSDLDAPLSDAVTVQGRLVESGPGRFYWDAEIATRIDAPCRRCLTTVRVPVRQEVRALLTQGEDIDDPDTYAVPAEVNALDVSGIIREELILAVPEFVLCRDDCRGLCAQCGADLNAGPCDCRPEPDPRWAALEALKGARSDDDSGTE